MFALSKVHGCNPRTDAWEDPRADEISHGCADIMGNSVSQWNKHYARATNKRRRASLALNAFSQQRGFIVADGGAEQSDEDSL